MDFTLGYFFVSLILGRSGKKGVFDSGSDLAHHCLLTGRVNTGRRERVCALLPESVD